MCTSVSWENCYRDGSILSYWVHMNFQRSSAVIGVLQSRREWALFGLAVFGSYPQWWGGICLWASGLFWAATDTIPFKAYHIFPVTMGPHQLPSHPNFELAVLKVSYAAAGERAAFVFWWFSWDISWWSAYYGSFVFSAAIAECGSSASDRYWWVVRWVIDRWGGFMVVAC